ncbi:3'(2'),5'-bisphosphate nucleotidase CysQ [Pontivivens insulae]|uniref:Inositol-1-monophosphatase n=1 Tax=Pontivivens insulae TaxID=1639689 RepID=A0A2R8AEP6_9RHOB|nr:3'(2'),5'-bisphosphate nucleotidase CysQ [Pontivivens insulae]RED11936.1 myo-inositol-1(or 4)-monophosphatase [Pontivivens insulae]SPF30692.1 Inositol-1-monophosphatase [Pontivivens insulae]
MQGHKADRLLLEQAARDAGALALTHFGNRPKRWSKEDNSPVSEADLAVDARLRDILLAARPDYGWLSEETADTPDRLACEQVFIVDPIDGTRAFLRGEQGWCIALAVATGGKVTASAIYAPVTDTLYSAALGDGAYRDGAVLSGSGRTSIEGASISIPRDYLAANHWPGGAPPVTAARSGALALRLARAASGEVDGSVSLRPVWEWDSSAGTLLAMEAGLLATREDGQPTVFNSATPRHQGLIVAPPPLHAALVAARSG